jgi:dTDP-4-amino-4,6-dideoxygalactose transaminase
VSGDKFELYRRAAERGIDFAFSFTYVACPADFEIAHRIAAEVLDLPFYGKLSEGEMDRVVSTLRELDSEMAAS